MINPNANNDKPQANKLRDITMYL